MKPITLHLNIWAAFALCSLLLATPAQAQTRRSATRTAKARTTQVRKQVPNSARTSRNARAGKTTLRVGRPVTIIGTTEGIADGKKVYLAMIRRGQTIYIDSVAVKKGAFTFRGQCDTPPQVLLLSVGPVKRESLLADFFLEPGTIKAHLVEGKFASHVTGTRHNNIYSVYIDSLNRLRTNVAERYKYADNAPAGAKMEKLRQASDTIIKVQNAYSYDFISHNLDNYVGIYLLNQYFQSFTIEQNKALVAKMSDKMKQTPLAGSICRYIDIKARTLAGQPFVDFKAQRLDSTQFHFADMVKAGHYVYLHFWSDKVGKSYLEVPAVVDAYQKLHDRGLDIVSIYMGTDSAKWRDMTDKFKMSWIQVSDLKGNASPIAAQFGLDELPFALLIGPDGKIADRDLRSAKLKARVEQLLADTDKQQ